MTLIKEMHKKTIEWNKLLEFYSQELTFFNTYIHDYSKRMSDMDKRDIINVFDEKIKEYTKDCQALITESCDEEQELLLSIEDVNYSELGAVEDKHNLLNKRIQNLENGIKSLKEGIYDFFIETSAT